MPEFPAVRMRLRRRARPFLIHGLYEDNFGRTRRFFMAAGKCIFKCLTLSREPAYYYFLMLSGDMRVCQSAENQGGAVATYIDSESEENYLETILLLSGSGSFVRGIDIAKKLKVSRPSVSRAVGLLRDKGLVILEKGSFISLTEDGKKLARKVAAYHRLLRSFLVYAAGISPEQADIDACRVEHVVSASTVKGIRNFLKRENVPADSGIDSSHLPEIGELNESGENYIEHIYMMSRDGKRVRSTDLAQALGVSRASISRAMDVLTNLGLLNRGEKGDLILTPAGEEKARSIYARHVVLTGFLEQLLGVSQKIAERDACRMEHMLSEAAFNGLRDFWEKKQGGSTAENATDG